MTDPDDMPRFARLREPLDADLPRSGWIVWALMGGAFLWVVILTAAFAAEAVVRAEIAAEQMGQRF